MKRVACFLLCLTILFSGLWGVDVYTVVSLATDLTGVATIYTEPQYGVDYAVTGGSASFFQFSNYKTAIEKEIKDGKSTVTISEVEQRWYQCLYEYKNPVIVCAQNYGFACLTSYEIYKVRLLEVIPQSAGDVRSSIDSNFKFTWEEKVKNGEVWGWVLGSTASNASSMEKYLYQAMHVYEIQLGDFEDDTDDTIDWGQELLDDLNRACGNNQDEVQKRLQTIQIAWNTLRSLGYSEAASAAVLGNAWGESKYDVACIERDANKVFLKGVGLWQWSDDPGNRGEFVKRHQVDPCVQHPSATVTKADGSTFTFCTDAACQTEFLIQQLNSSGRIGVWSQYYNEIVADGNYSELHGAISPEKSLRIPGSITSGIDSITAFKTVESLADAVVVFFLDYETAASTKCFWKNNGAHSTSTDVQSQFITSFNERYLAANTIYKVFTGSEFDGFTSGVSLDGITLRTSGFYTEADISAYSRLYEQNIQKDFIDNATRGDLSSSELSVLHDWENNNEMGSKGSGAITWLRKIVSLFGILLILWSFFLYVAYWLDKMNNLIDISFVTLLTFGKLATHMDDTTKCTFHSKDVSGVRTVDHGAIIFICILGMVVGALVVSGGIYTWLSKFVFWILGKLS